MWEGGKLGNKRFGPGLGTQGQLWRGAADRCRTGTQRARGGAGAGGLGHCCTHSQGLREGGPPSRSLQQSLAPGAAWAAPSGSASRSASAITLQPTPRFPTQLSACFSSHDHTTASCRFFLCFVSCVLSSLARKSALGTASESVGTFCFALCAAGRCPHDPSPVSGADPVPLSTPPLYPL